MNTIKLEIDEVESGVYSKENNVLKNAPHTEEMLVADNWELPYTRQKAAYPVAQIKGRKFWPKVRRVDDAYGDRNLICSCPPIEDYLA